MVSDYDNSGLAPPRHMTSDHNCLELIIQDHDNEHSSSKLVPNVSPSTHTTAPSQQEFDLLFGPLYDEFFTAGTLSVNKSSSPTYNSTQEDTQPTSNIHPTTEPINLTINVDAEENNNDQAGNAQFEAYEFIN
ncbi:hypothetical protein Tco_0159544, partial [Tanacetum coccineum]